MPTALVFGNSHVGPYIRGHRLAQAEGLIGFAAHEVSLQGARYEPRIRNEPGRGLLFNPAIAEDICAAIEKVQPVCLITAVMGSAHWIQGMSLEPRPFDFLVPRLPHHALTPETEIIPYDLMLRRYQADMDWQFGVVRSVQKISKLPIFHIEAPPPVESVELMLKGLPQHAETKAKMERHGLPSVAFRYKVWWATNDTTQRICADIGLHFIAGPSETRSANGFLDPHFYNDGIHGNDQYGKVMAREISRTMQKLGVESG